MSTTAYVVKAAARRRRRVLNRSASVRVHDAVGNVVEVSWSQAELLQAAGLVGRFAYGKPRR